VYTPFLAHGAVMPVPTVAVVNIVDSFCTSLGY
jgi:hypothetical protein